MLQWWNGLSLSSQIFAAIAIPATAVMLVQALLVLLGIGLDGDVDGDGMPDADFDHDGLGLISVRGIVAFFSVGGWAGFVADGGGLPIPHLGAHRAHRRADCSDPHRPALPQHLQITGGRQSEHRQRRRQNRAGLSPHPPEGAGTGEDQRPSAGPPDRA